MLSLIFERKFEKKLLRNMLSKEEPNEMKIGSNISSSMLCPGIEMFIVNGWLIRMPPPLKKGISAKNPLIKAFRGFVFIVLGFILRPLSLYLVLFCESFRSSKTFRLMLFALLLEEKILL